MKLSMQSAVLVLILAMSVPAHCGELVPGSHARSGQESRSWLSFQNFALAGAVGYGIYVACQLKIERDKRRGYEAYLANPLKQQGNILGSEQRQDSKGFFGNLWAFFKGLWYSKEGRGWDSYFVQERFADELFQAIQSNNEDHARFMIQCGADINGCRDTILCGLIDSSTTSNSDPAENVRMALRLGADPNMRNPLSKRTPLISATWCGQPKTVKALLDAGARVDLKVDEESDHRTALSLAEGASECSANLQEKRRYQEIVRLLRQAEQR